MKTVSRRVRLAAKDHTYGINNGTSISSPFLGEQTRLKPGAKVPRPLVRDVSLQDPVSGFGARILRPPIRDAPCGNDVKKAAEPTASNLRYVYH